MFNIGDLVQIKKTSEYYGRDDVWNPGDVAGTIIEINEDAYDGYIYKVKWPLDGSNDYRYEDIESGEVVFHIQPSKDMRNVSYFGVDFLIPNGHKYMVINTDKSISSYKTKPFFGFFWSSKDGESSLIAQAGSCTTYIDIRETLREV